MVHFEEMNAYNPFCASLDYEDEMSVLWRFSNDVPLSHMKKIIRNEQCTQI